MVSLILISSIGEEHSAINYDPSICFYFFPPLSDCVQFLHTCKTKHHRSICYLIVFESNKKELLSSYLISATYFKTYEANTLCNSYIFKLLLNCFCIGCGIPESHILSSASKSKFPAVSILK